MTRMLQRLALACTMACLAAAAAAASPAAARSGHVSMAGLQPNDRPHRAASAGAEALLEVDVGAMRKDAKEYITQGMKILSLGRQWLDASEEMEQLRASAPDLADQMWMARTMAKVTGVVGTTAGDVRHANRKTALRVVTALFDEVAGGTCTALQGDVPPKVLADFYKAAGYKEQADSVSWPEFRILLALAPNSVVGSKSDPASTSTFKTDTWMLECKKLCQPASTASNGMHATDTAKFCAKADSAGKAVTEMHKKWAEGRKGEAKTDREAFFASLVEILADRMRNMPDADTKVESYTAEQKHAVASAAALPHTCARLQGMFLFLAQHEQEKMETIDAVSGAVDAATGAIVSAGKVAASVVAGPAVAAGSGASKKTLSMLSASLGAGTSLAGVLEGRMASVVADSKKLRMHFRKLLVEASADMLKGDPDWAVGGTTNLPIEPAKCREQLVSLAAVWTLATGSVEALHEQLKNGDLSGLLLTDEREKVVNAHSPKQKANLVRAYKDLHKLDERMEAFAGLGGMSLEKFNSVVKDVTKAGESVNKLANMEAAADKKDKAAATQKIRDQTAGVKGADGKLIDSKTAVEAGKLVREDAKAATTARQAAANTQASP